MIKEYSAGAIVFRRAKEGILFLLILTRKSRNWGFPKGHREEGESMPDTARREIREETGISDIAFIDGFQEELVYPITSKLPASSGKPAEKHSLYYLCETSQAQVAIDNQEIVDHKWVSYDDSLAYLRFDASKQMLAKAAQLLFK